MTFRERLKKERPGNVGSIYEGGCIGCPSNYGYEDCSPCFVKSDTYRKRDCQKCWDRACPEPKKKAVYIAGPITGIDDYRERFEKAEKAIADLGFVPLSPARNPYGLTNEQYMLMNVSAITVASAVYFLPGFQSSYGAQLEMQYAKYIDKPIATTLKQLQEVLNDD